MSYAHKNEDLGGLYSKDPHVCVMLRAISCYDNKIKTFNTIAC